MDAIRTLLLARTHVVVLDPDLVASAATRPSRDADVDRFEDELVQLGFVLSLDLAITIRRLPHQAIQGLRTWMLDTLAKTLGAHRPHVPLVRTFPAGTPGDPPSRYLCRVLSWLFTRPVQPCPWCGQVTTIGALDPCGHLVCRTCWDGGSFGGCPICHRRVAPSEPFVRPPADPPTERVAHHPGELRLLQLALDLAGTARLRFEHLLTRATPLSPDDRAEVETVIDALGPRAASWMPAEIAVAETMAIAVARLWTVSPDRPGILRATRPHLRTATDVLRVAVVLMGGDPGLAEPLRLGPITRGLRRLVLEALDRMDPGALAEEVGRHPRLWKRAGERLHPFEHAKRLPTAALAFAIVRGTRVGAASFGPSLRAHVGQLARLRIEEDRVRVRSWAGIVEDHVRAGDVRRVAVELAARPGALLRRADHLVRMTQVREPEALGAILEAIGRAVRHGPPLVLLTLAAHVARRDHVAPFRVFFPRSEVLCAWGTRDDRPPLCAEAIDSIVRSVRDELVTRAATRRHLARAVIDRALVDLRVPNSARRAAKARITWPRGSALVGVDVADLAASHARATLWEVACIHAAARANIVYVRERDGTITQVRRRDGELAAARLARLLAGDHDGPRPAIPAANAPTWFAIVRDGLELPTGSEGFLLEAPPARGDGITRLSAADLVAQLARHGPA